MGDALGRRRLLQTTVGGVLAGTAVGHVSLSATLAQETGTVLGIVTDRTGSPVTDATVTLLDGGTEVAAAQTDTNGQYGLSVAPGTYELTVEKAGFSPFSSSVTIESGGEQVTVNVTLDPPEPGAVVGVVTDDSDTRISGADVVLFEDDAEIAAGSTDEDGLYAMAALPGSYAVEVTKSGYKLASETVTVTSGEATVLDFTLEAGPPTLPGFDNAPRDLDGDGLFEDVDGDGEFNILDVQTLFIHLDSIAVQNNAASFNFNERSNPVEVTIFDVQALFDRLD